MRIEESTRTRERDVRGTGFSANCHTSSSRHTMSTDLTRIEQTLLEQSQKEAKELAQAHEAFSKAIEKDVQAARVGRLLKRSTSIDISFSLSP